MPFEPFDRNADLHRGDSAAIDNAQLNAGTGGSFFRHVLGDIFVIAVVLLHLDLLKMRGVWDKRNDGTGQHGAEDDGEYYDSRRGSVVEVAGKEAEGAEGAEEAEEAEDSVTTMHTAAMTTRRRRKQRCCACCNSKCCVKCRGCVVAGGKWAMAAAWLGTLTVVSMGKVLGRTLFNDYKRFTNDVGRVKPGYDFYK
jgi:hypothetical protein